MSKNDCGDKKNAKNRNVKYIKNCTENVLKIPKY